MNLPEGGSNCLLLHTYIHTHKMHACKCTSGMNSFVYFVLLLVCLCAIENSLASSAGNNDDKEQLSQRALVRVEAFRHQKFHDAMTVPATAKIQQLKQKRQEVVAQEFSALLEATRMHASAVDRLSKKMSKNQ